MNSFAQRQSIADRLLDGTKQAKGDNQKQTQMISIFEEVNDFVVMEIVIILRRMAFSRSNVPIALRFVDDSRSVCKENRIPKTTQPR